MKKTLIQNAIDNTIGDSIQHYGIRGMHWGTRKGKIITKSGNATEGIGVINAVKGVAKSLGNSVAHPYISVGVRAKNAATHPILSATSPISMMKKNNQEIRGEALKKRMYKEAVHQQRNAVGDARGKILTAKSERKKVDPTDKKKYKIAVKNVKAAKKRVKQVKRRSEGVAKVLNSAGKNMTSKEFRATKKSRTNFVQRVKDNNVNTARMFGVNKERK